MSAMPNTTMPAMLGAPGGPGGGQDQMNGQPQPPQGTDGEFERAFFSLAFKYVQDKAPTLIEHLVGFQILDKDEDEERAAGVFMFQVGRRQLAAPVIFLNGELKGFELLYLPDENKFRPLQENWVNYLLRQSVAPMGQSADQSFGYYGRTQPDLRSFYDTPVRGQKISSLNLDPSTKQAVAAMFSYDPSTLKWPEAPLDRWLEHPYGVHALTKLARWMLDDPELGNALASFYPPTKIAALLRSAVEDAELFGGLPGSRPLDQTKVSNFGAHRLAVVVDNPDAPERFSLSEQEKEALAAGELVVLDNRPTHKIATAFKLSPDQQLVNPTEPGVYQLLTRRGDFVDAFVSPVARPICSGSTRRLTTVVTDDQDRTGNNFYTSDVWVRPQPVKTYKEFYEKLPELSALRPGEHIYVLMNAQKDVTVPFQVINKIKRPDGSTQLQCKMLTGRRRTASRYGERMSTPAGGRFSTSSSGVQTAATSDSFYDTQMTVDWSKKQKEEQLAGGSVPATMPGGASINPFDNSDDQSLSELGGSWSDAATSQCMIILGRVQGTTAVASGTMLSVPDGYRVLEIKNTLRGPSDPGGLADIELGFAKAGCYQIKVASDGRGDYWVEDVHNSKTLRAGTRKQAFEHLLNVVGLRKEGAAAILTEVEAADSPIFFWIRPPGDLRPLKQALADDGMGLVVPSFTDPPVGYDQATGAATMYPDRQRLPMPLPYAPTGGQVDPLSPGDYKSLLMSATKTKQPGLVDVASLGSILRSMEVEDSLDREIGKLEVALDTLGRVLLAFYWHNDKFAERFGANELPDLEAGLRNTFKGLGDLTIFLKQRSIDQSSELQDINLEQIN